MHLRLACLEITNGFALLRPMPGSDRDKDAEIVAGGIKRDEAPLNGVGVEDPRRTTGHDRGATTDEPRSATTNAETNAHRDLRL